MNLRLKNINHETKERFRTDRRFSLNVIVIILEENWGQNLNVK